MALIEGYRGYGVVCDFTDHWSAKVYPPGSDRPHGVIVRATEQEGQVILTKRVKTLIDTLAANRPDPRSA